MGPKPASSSRQNFSKKKFARNPLSNLLAENFVDFPQCMAANTKQCTFKAPRPSAESDSILLISRRLLIRALFATHESLTFNCGCSQSTLLSMRNMSIAPVRFELFFLSRRLFTTSAAVLVGRKDNYFESQTVQASERKRSRDYKEATASAEALIARQLNTRPAW